jgi:hypothetical protein
MRHFRGVRSAPAVSLITILLLSSAPSPALAVWPSLGRAICAAPGDQIRPRAASDALSGAIIVWKDSRSTKVNVFAHHVLGDGELDPRWPVDGQALLSDSTALANAAGGQEAPVIVSDGVGGAIVAWQDARSPLSGPDIFAQHILASGVVDPAWPPNGRALCTAAGQQEGPAIVSDGAGGAIVTWMDGRSEFTGVDIYAQHVRASGAVDPAWPVDGAALSIAIATQASPKVVSDGTGGAIVTWHDFRPSASGVDIYAQHIRSVGTVDPAWPVNGRALCLATGSQVQPEIAPDGAHGAIVTWEDEREGVPHVFAQRVQASGAIAAGWPADGRAVCTAQPGQNTPIIAPDGASGAIIAWQDARGILGRNMFAQHILASSSIDPAWPTDGRSLSGSSGDATNGSIVVDGAGGAILAWEESSFVMVHHILASGTPDPTFPQNGLFVRLNLDFQHTPDLVRAGTGAIVAWRNRASPAPSDIYALLVIAGVAGVSDPGGAPEVTFARPSPNPARDPMTFRFSLSRPMSVRLALFDASGRRLRELASGVRPPGEHFIPWDLLDGHGRRVGAGVYFAKLEVGGRTFTRKVSTLK